jgi:hypothetical protein
MTDERKETLSNLRAEYHEILLTMRHTDTIAMGVAGFLIPLTLSGFLALDSNQGNNQIKNNIYLIGIGSIVLWVVFWVVTFYVTQKLEKLKNYIQYTVEVKLNSLTKMMGDEDATNHDMSLANNFLFQDLQKPTYFWIIAVTSLFIMCLWGITLLSNFVQHCCHCYIRY